MKLVDTTVAIDHLRGHEPAVALLIGLLESEEPLLASEVVRFELLAGVRPHEMPDLELFFEALLWVPIDEEIARVSGELAREYRAAHTGIDTADYLIAGTALVLQGELLTTNTKHFPMLPGLSTPY